MTRKKALVVCGPTAAGKSSLADALAEELSMVHGAYVPTVVVDSMQVYKEIPLITNQARQRRAEMVGIVSVAEEWTVARHKEQAEGVISPLAPDLPFLLDAGTGMYLNALVLDIRLASKAPERVREDARKLAEGAENPRREARRLELEMIGATGRGSIWDGELRYDAAFVYLRPTREELDRNITVRSRRISREGGAEEAKRLEKSGLEPNPSVLQAIGVREMLLHASGRITKDEAERTIAARTRKLARRQVRWFDKLAGSLTGGTARVLVVENADDGRIKHLTHDIIGA